MMDELIPVINTMQPVPFPWLTVDLSMKIKWKQFDLNIFFTYSLGRHILKIYDDIAIKPNITGDPITLDIRKASTWTVAQTVKTRTILVPSLQKSWRTIHGPI